MSALPIERMIPMIPISALDADVLAELRGLDDGDFVRDLFATYIEQTDSILAQLRGCYESGDATLFARAAHALAGSSLHVGAVDLATVCRSIECELSDDSCRPDMSQLVMIEDEIGRVMAAIADEIA